MDSALAKSRFHRREIRSPRVQFQHIKEEDFEVGVAFIGRVKEEMPVRELRHVPAIIA